jgi:hypothetical protein
MPYMIMMDNWGRSSGQAPDSWSRIAEIVAGVGLHVIMLQGVGLHVTSVSRSQGDIKHTVYIWTGPLRMVNYERVMQKINSVLQDASDKRQTLVLESEVHYSAASHGGRPKKYPPCQPCPWNDMRLSLMYLVVIRVVAETHSAQ